MDPRQRIQYHLVASDDLLNDAEDCESECILADGDSLRVTKKGSVLLHATARGEQRTLRPTDVYYAPSWARNIISYGRLGARVRARLQEGAACRI